MPQTAVSGSGYNNTDPNVYEYRVAYVGDYRQPLNYDKHGYPVHTSAVRQLVYSGFQTWNKTSEYDYSDYQPVTRREPIIHQEPRYIINYMANNPSDPVAATPIAISQYAISTGLIYVGQGAGNWGGIQTGQISPGGNNAY